MPKSFQNLILGGSRWPVEVIGEGIKGLDTIVRWEFVWVSKGGKEEEYFEEVDENIIQLKGRDGSETGDGSLDVQRFAIHLSSLL